MFPLNSTVAISLPSKIYHSKSSGAKVALVGKMGSGKSTLSRLIAGIYEPTEGAILVDGVDVRQIDQADIRKILGLCCKTAGFSQVP